MESFWLLRANSEKSLFTFPILLSLGMYTFDFRAYFRQYRSVPLCHSKRYKTQHACRVRISSHKVKELLELQQETRYIFGHLWYLYESLILPELFNKFGCPF